MDYAIERLDVAGAMAELPALRSLLEDAVLGGASVGFVLPLSAAEVEAYWQGVCGSLRDNGRILLVARQAGMIMGTVQIALEPRSNGAHRAEIQKLLVLRAARRLGLGRALMAAAEAVAREHNRTLLLLDTRHGHPAEQLYVNLGYTLVGIIPGHARDPDGSFQDTAIFYRRLDDAPMP